MICPSAERLDPRVRRTRKLLQDAFRSLLREKRFSTISVQDIAERSTVNRATFYAHYVDKEDLAISVVAADLHDALSGRIDVQAAFNYENLVSLAVAMFEFLAALYDACPETAADLQNTVGSTIQQAIYEITEHWLSANRAHMRLFPNASKDTIATVISWSIYGAAYEWTRAKDRAPAQDVCREIVGVLMPVRSERNGAYALSK